MSLSIFNFAKREKTAQPGGRASEPVAQPSPSSIVIVDEVETPQKVFLDLNNLTPETLAAFFPSEQTLKRAK